MLETDKVFAGSVPESYNRHMVPLIFEPYAAGVVNRTLAPKLSPDAGYTVTDLNRPMPDYAASRQPSDGRITWRQVDALALPFENATFDLVCCQFGAMFSPTVPRHTRRLSVSRGKKP